MSSVTGIELGPDCCALVRAQWRDSTAAVSAAHLIAPAEWPREPYELAQRLSHARSGDRLPRRAHVVVWNGLDPRAPADLARILPLQPVVSAGFEIAGILSPAQALARIVRLRHGSREQAVAALALNTHGAAIAIVRGEEILYSRRFGWALGRPFSGARAELLDRYLLVSQLAPQLKHGIRFVRPVHHAVVTSAIACGNLPDLRSLSMLLIEELDLEVDTLDSATLLDLPRIDPSAHARLAESIPALQLASAAASLDFTGVPSGIADDPGAGAVDDTGAQPGAPPPSAAPRRSRALRIAAAASLILGAIWSYGEWAASRPALPIADRSEILRLANRSDLLPIGDSAVRVDPLRAENGGGQPVADSTDQVEATIGRVRQRRPAVVENRQLPDLPEVEGVVISGARRLALVNGLTVAPGDLVGLRAVARIEPNGVVLREPDGAEVFVPVRGRRVARGPAP
jgi:hypothetical protein